MASPSKYMYYRLDIEELPEPDVFELEKIYYEEPPPSLFKLAMRWTIRNLLLLFLLSLFIIASILYISTSIPEKPNFNQILRTSVSSLKHAEVAEVAAQTSDGDTVQIDVSGSDVLNTDGDDIVLDGATLNVTTDGGIDIQLTPSNTTITTSSGSSDTQDTDSPKNATHGIDSSDSTKNATHGIDSTDSTDSTGSNNNATATKPPPSSGGKDGGQVSIQKPTEADKEPFTPIKATFYSGVDGPKNCRGHVIAVINLPKPQASGVPTAQQCYNFPNLAYSGCATFMANKVDGCIANVFEEPNCLSYMNTAAFMPEYRAMGGHWRSVQVQCGVPEPDPESLGKPPMVDSITGLVDNDKAG